MSKKFYFYCDCVSWNPADVDCEGGLVDMIDNSIDITRRTFLSHVDRESLRFMEIKLGYKTHPSNGLTMSTDYHVSYHRSNLHGRRVYYFKQSAIEYVFVN